MWCISTHILLGLEVQTTKADKIRERLNKISKEAWAEKKLSVDIDNTAGEKTVITVNSIDDLDCTKNIKSDESKIENT